MAELHKAAEKGLTPVVRSLLADGCDVNEKDEEGLTPVWYKNSYLGTVQGHR